MFFTVGGKGQGKHTQRSFSLIHLDSCCPSFCWNFF